MARALAADPPVLLMDEPFGAVDPIVRARLQDELLDLQERVRKTIVLVTHDIDEAITLGDRVAVLNVGGVLEQYGTPDDLLAAPGQRVRRARSSAPSGASSAWRSPGWPTSTSRGGPVVAAACRPRRGPRRSWTATAAGWLGLVRDGRFLGWVHAEALDGPASARRARPRAAAAQVRPESTLREALEIILTSRASAAVVADDGDRFAGVVTLERIREGWA